MASAGSELEELTKEYDKNQEIIKALKKLCKVAILLFVYLEIYLFIYLCFIYIHSYSVMAVQAFHTKID